MIVTPFSRNSSAASPREQMSSAPISGAEDCANRTAVMEAALAPFEKRIGQKLIEVLDELNSLRHGGDVDAVCSELEDTVLAYADKLPGTLAHKSILDLIGWCTARSAELDELAGENGAYVRDANGHYGVCR